MDDGGHGGVDVGVHVSAHAHARVDGHGDVGGRGGCGGVIVEAFEFVG